MDALSNWNKSDAAQRKGVEEHAHVHHLCHRFIRRDLVHGVSDCDSDPITNAG